MPTKSKSAGVFSKEEQDAMRARAKELAAEAKVAKNRALGESTLLEAVAAMPEADRKMAKRIHEIVMQTAPQLFPKTWYGMPAWANSDGKVICFFQSASKFKVRYSTFGFDQAAKLDDGNMWPAGFALIKLTPAEEARIIELVKRAVN